MNKSNLKWYSVHGEIMCQTIHLVRATSEQHALEKVELNDIEENLEGYEPVRDSKFKVTKVELDDDCND